MSRTERHDIAIRLSLPLEVSRATGTLNGDVAPVTTPVENAPGQRDEFALPRLSSSGSAGTVPMAAA